MKAFDEWIGRFEHRYKVVIGGNHDRVMAAMDADELRKNVFTNCHYLDNDTLTISEFGDLKIFGTGWSPKGSGNNAFQGINDKMTN